MAMNRITKKEKAHKITGIVLIGSGVLLLLFAYIFKRQAEKENLPQGEDLTLSIANPEPPSDVEIVSMPNVHAAIETKRQTETDDSEEYQLDSSLWVLPTVEPAESETPLGLWSGSSAQIADTSIKVAHEKLQKEQQYSALPASGAAPTDASINTAANLHVEFWESPVNYKGYRLEGNKLIMYGVSPSDSLRFQKHSDGVLMYHKKNIFLLKPCQELNRFNEVNDESK